MKGYLITFEGIDGSGKSTQADLLAKRLISCNRSVHLLSEPGGTAIGESIRSILLDTSNSSMSFHTELFLYLAARSQITSTVIKPALHRGEDVIMDRYIDSTTAYQGYARGLGIYEMIQLNLIATGGLIPDITFIVDCAPDVAYQRISSEPDRLESEGIGFMRKVREGFIKLHEYDKQRIILCNGNRSIDEIEQDIAYHIKNKLMIC